MSVFFLWKVNKEISEGIRIRFILLPPLSAYHGTGTCRFYVLILNFNSKRGNLCGHATRCPCKDRSIAPAAPSCRKLVKFEALCSGKLNEPDSSVAAILIHLEDSLPSIQRWSRILRPSIRIRYFFLFSKALLFPFFLSFFFVHVRSLHRNGVY